MDDDPNREALATLRQAFSTALPVLCDAGEYEAAELVRQATALLNRRIDGTPLTSNTTVGP